MGAESIQADMNDIFDIMRGDQPADMEGANIRKAVHDLVRKEY